MRTAKCCCGASGSFARGRPPEAAWLGRCARSRASGGGGSGKARTRLRGGRCRGCAGCEPSRQGRGVCGPSDSWVPSPLTASDCRVLCLEWMAHWNAVFDLAWVPGEFKLVSGSLSLSGSGSVPACTGGAELGALVLKVTAAGDQTARLWDVSAGELMGTCKGHQCSLKSVAFSKFEKGRWVCLSPRLWCWVPVSQVFSARAGRGSRRAERLGARRRELVPFSSSGAALCCSSENRFNILC